MPTGNTQRAVDHYCERLRRALGNAPAAERDEIVEEVRSHILDRVEAEGPLTGQVLNEVLRAVGDPEDLASEYRMHAMLRRAARSHSPWRLLHTTLRWATRGLAGAVAFVITLVGYGCAAVFYLSAFLKPFLPSRIGLWLGSENTLTFGYWSGRLGSEVYGVSVRPPVSFVLGTLGPSEGPVRELLGPWLVPVGIVCGVFFLLATTLFARWLIGRFGKGDQPPLPRAPST